MRRPPVSQPQAQQPGYQTWSQPQSQESGIKASLFGRRISRKYSHIGDDFHTLDQVQQALSQAGLESSNLIVGIDFTKSNEWTGKQSFQGRSLHAIGKEQNPYEKALSILGQTLAPFDEDNLIPCFGFGDSSTHDQNVFSFLKDNRPCQGFEEALARYKTILPHLHLAGPTSFAPIIDAAVEIVENSGGQYHVLIILADGQVTRSINTTSGRPSPQGRATIDSIVNASAYPLSIVLVGLGDGPWDMMREFDDNLPARSFDNFQFVNFTEIMQTYLPQPQKEVRFALSALMEIPSQYKATLELGILGQKTGKRPGKSPLPPPPAVLQADAISHVPSRYGFTQGQSTDRPQPPDFLRPAVGSQVYPPPVNPVLYGGHPTY